MGDHGWGLVVAGVGIFGTLAGALVNNILGGRSQRSHWLADQKKQELRELLTALAKAFTLALKFRSMMGPEDRSVYDQTMMNAIVTINDRVFIDEEINKMHLMERWAMAVQEFDRERDVDKFSLHFGKIRNELAVLARKMD